MKFSQFFFTWVLVFLGSILPLYESFAQEIVWHDGRQPIVVPQETKDYILGLFQKGFAHRDQIVTGQMDITYDLSKADKNGNRETIRTREIFIAFDEKRRRIDTREMSRYNPAAGNNTTHYVSLGCIGCYEGDNRLLVEHSRYIKKDVPPSHSILSIFDTGLQFQGQKVTNTWTEYLDFIPQYIAYIHTDRFPTRKTLDGEWDLLSSNTLEMLDSGITNVTIRDEDYKGVLCKKVVFETKWKDGRLTRNSLWFAEGQGYALRKNYFESALMYDELLEVDVALDTGSGIWFPSAWHYEKNRHGKTGTAEDGTIKNVILNQPIPEKVFTMEDIKDIPAGASVFWNTDKFPTPYGARPVGALLWDGSKIVTRGMFAESMVEKIAEENQKKWQSKRFKIILLVNIAGISLICAIFLWRYYQRL